jgi:hypothetical protein
MEAKDSAVRQQWFKPFEVAPLMYSEAMLSGT